MKSPSVRVLAFLLCVGSPLALNAQTWVGGTVGNTNNFNTPGNWTGGFPVSNASTNITFGNTSYASTNFPGPFIVNSLTFTGSQTYDIGGGALSVGAGGIDSNSGSGGANLYLPITFTANQTWTIETPVNVNGNVTDGPGTFSLTKSGGGTLVLSGNNTYDGGTTVNDGALYLGSSNSSSGTIAVSATGTLGAAYSDLSLGNAVTLASGATLGGSAQGGGGELEFNGVVTLSSATTTLNVAHGAVIFKNTLAGQTSSALTVDGTGNGLVVLAGSATNFDSMVADNAGIAFGGASSLPATSVGALNGGYVSTVYFTGSSPTTAALVAKISDKTNFDGTLGFDTDDNASTPHTYDLTGVDLSGFTHANFALGTATMAVLTGAVTTPQANYNFRGFGDIGGGLFVQSDLGGSKGVVVTSPNSGGAISGGLYLFLQGDNSYSGNLSVTDSAVVLDSATALPSKSFSVGADSYVGYTETASGGGASQYSSFADFAESMTSYDFTGGTSVLGLDSHGPLVDFVAGNPSGTTASRTVTFASDGDIDLSGFTKIYLGTLSGVTIASDVTISAPGDNNLRLVNMADIGKFTINSALSSSNVGSVTVGMAGSEGIVVLGADNSYTGGTSLLGGKLLVGNGTSTALGSGDLTVAANNGDLSSLGTASGSANLANNIILTGSLEVGTGNTDEEDQRYLAGTTSLSLSGVISGSGQLHVTGLTTLSGANTSFTGGTFILADTTVSNDAGLGTGSVFIGYSDSDSDSGVPVVPVKSTLTFTTTAPSIGFLSDANMSVFNGGSGNIHMTGSSPTLTINQTGPSPVGTFSGQFTGNVVAIVKNGTGQLALTGANENQISSVAINGGSLAIGDGFSTSATFNGNVSLAGGGLFFRPGAGQTLYYNGSITTGSSGGVTINGNNSGVTDIIGGASTFTGSTMINSGTLRVTSDNSWSSASSTTVNGGTTLDLVGSQTIKNLSGNGTVSIAGSKTLTVNSVGNTTFSGGMIGSGGLTKSGSGSFTLSHISANTYTGNTTVSAGTLVVNGSLASPTVTVNSGASLQGTGTLNNVFLDGAFQPGNGGAGVGTLDSLTMSGTGLLHMEIGGTDQGSSYDFLNITSSTGGTGIFTANGALSVTFFGGYNPGGAVSFNLFDFDSASGGFTGFNLPGLTAGLSWDTTALLTTGELSIIGTAIPEPSTYAALAGLAAFGLAAWRRRSHRVRAEVQIATRF